MMAQARMKSLSTDLRSPFMGVSNVAWSQFVHALSISDDSGPGKGLPRRFNAVSYAGGLGCFALLPRRLVEIGALKEIVIRKGKVMVSPDDRRRLMTFLSNPIEQADYLVLSMRRYDLALPSPLPEGMTRSGALALHHRLGPKAFEKWARHQEPSTTALFQRTNGLF